MAPKKIVILLKKVTEHPRTLNKEWEEATNERMRQQKANPITGISSEGYKGNSLLMLSFEIYIQYINKNIRY